MSDHCAHGVNTRDFCDDCFSLGRTVRGPSSAEVIDDLRAQLQAERELIERCRRAVEPLRNESGTWVEYVETLAADLKAERERAETIKAGLDREIAFRSDLQRDLKAEREAREKVEGLLRVLRDGASLSETWRKSALQERDAAIERAEKGEEAALNYAGLLGSAEAERDALRALVAKMSEALERFADKHRWTLAMHQTGYVFKGERPWQIAEAALQAAKKEMGE